MRCLHPAAIFDYLPDEIADVAAALAILTAPAKGIRPASRLVALAALRLIPTLTPPQLDRFDPQPRRDVHDRLDGPTRLHQAALGLLCRPPTGGRLAWWAVRQVEHAERPLRGLPAAVGRAGVQVRHRIGWCAAVAADLPPADLMAAARRHASEQRRAQYEMRRRRERYATA